MRIDFANLLVRYSEKLVFVMHMTMFLPLKNQPRTQVRDLWEEYYAGADGIVFMIDSADTQRFAEAREELTNLLKHESLQDTPVLLLGNKDDLQVGVVYDRPCLYACVCVFLFVRVCDNLSSFCCMLSSERASVVSTEVLFL
jgi:hypothetical protein